MFPRVSSWSSLSSTSTGRASFERTSLDKGPSSAPPQRHSTVTNALNIDVGQLLHQEMIAGGVLHVSVAQAHSCMERFEDLDSLAAPALPALDTFLAAANSQVYSSSSTTGGNSMGPSASQVLYRLGSSGERMLEEALCLATAPDNPTEDTSPLEQPRADRRPRTVSTATLTSSSSTTRPAPAVLRMNAPGQAARAPANSSSTDGVEAVEQIESVAACQHCTAEALGEDMPRTSQVLARARRRRILRLMRDTRETRDSLVATLKSSSAAQLLTLLSSTFANLTTLDGIDVEVCDADGCVMVWNGAAAASGSDGEQAGASAAAVAGATAAVGRVDSELAAWLGGADVSPACDHDCMACLRFPHGMCAYAP